jgi:hypothetical protein
MLRPWLLLSSVLLAACSSAIVPAPAEVEPRVTLCVRTLGDAAHFLALQTGCELRADRYDRKLELSVREVPLSECLRRITEGCGVTVRRTSRGYWLGERPPIVRITGPTTGDPRVDLLLDGCDPRAVLEALEARVPLLTSSAAAAGHDPPPLVRLRLVDTPWERAALTLAKLLGMRTRRNGPALALEPASSPRRTDRLAPRTGASSADSWSEVVRATYVGQDERVLVVLVDGGPRELSLIGAGAGLLVELRCAREGDRIAAVVEHGTKRTRLLSLDPDGSSQLR